MRAIFNRPSQILVLSLLLFGKIFIVTRIASISGDDCLVLEKIFGFEKEGLLGNLVLFTGSTGFLYLHSQMLLWAQLVNLVNYNLNWLSFFHALLITTPAFILYFQTRRYSWAFLASVLAFLSPLTFIFSLDLMPLWWFSFLTGSLLLQLILRVCEGETCPVPFIILCGFAGGLSAAVYPSLAVLPAGILIWLFFQRERGTNAWIFLSGLIFGYAPFVFFYWEWMNNGQPLFTCRAGQGKIDVALLFSGIFRYVGVPPIDWNINSYPSLLRAEAALKVISSRLYLVFLGWVLYYLIKNKSNNIKNKSLWGAIGFIYFVFLIFTAITKTESWFHQCTNLWWLSPVVIAFLISEFKNLKRKNIFTVLVLAFASISLGLVYGERIVKGTTAEPAFSSNGKGPACWMQQKIIDDLANLAKSDLKTGSKKPILVQVDQIYFLMYSLPRVFHMQYPELENKVKWVPSNCDGWDLQVTRDFGEPHRLRLAFASDAWAVPMSPRRRAIKIFSSTDTQRPSLVCAKLSKHFTAPGLLLDTNGQKVNLFWEDVACEESVKTTIYFRVGLHQGYNLFWLYENTPLSSASESPGRPDDIFEVYDDFSQSSGLWLNSKPEMCSLADGSLQIKGANQQDTFITHQLRSFLTWPSGRMETKIRFPPGQGKRDAGLLFQQETREKPALFWYLSTTGMTALDRVGPDGLSQNLFWYNWFWSFVPLRWSTVTVEWDGAAIKTWVNEKEVMDIVIPESKGGGIMGLGVRLPPGNEVHFDWFRAYEKNPNLIIETKIGKSEMKTP